MTGSAQARAELNKAFGGPYEAAVDRGFISLLRD